MPRAGVLPSPTPTTPRTAERTEFQLELALSGSDSALLRVVATLHRRRCRILSACLHDDDRGAARLQVRVAAPPAYAARVEHWLSALVDVRRVAVLS